MALIGRAGDDKRMAAVVVEEPAVAIVDDTPDEVAGDAGEAAAAALGAVDAVERVPPRGSPTPASSREDAPGPPA